MEYLTYEEIADLLARLYRSEFSGKKNGRFKIGRTELATLSGRTYMRQATIDGIRDWLAEKHGLLLIDLGDEFPIIKEAIMRRYRKATNNVVVNFLDNPDETDFSEDEEDMD